MTSREYDQPRILILGASGQLGSDLLKVFGSEAIGLGHAEIEITDPKQTAEVVRKYNPQVVINTAAIVKSEWCELNPESCFSVNAQGAANVAQAANDIGASIVFISSDYVFDGENQSGYTEADKPRPINVYGQSKWEGEKLIQEINRQHYIIRTSWLFGYHVSHKGYDFPRLMLKSAKEQSVVRVVSDQIGSPTYTKDLALKIKELVARKSAYGIYHITNQGKCSWYEFAKRIFDITGTKTDLIPISSEESLSKIRRPKNSVLVNTKLHSLGIPLLRPWQEALVDYLSELELLVD